MDANRQRFWMLADADDWFESGAGSAVEYDLECRRLRLRDRRPRRPVRGAPNPPAAQAILSTPARALDAFGTTAFWNAEEGSLNATGGRGPGADPIRLWNAPPDVRAADLALGVDDVLYLALQQTDGDGVVVRSTIGLFDPRGRWQRPRVIEVELPGFRADRLATAVEGGVWVLDRSRRRLGRVRGLPWREGLLPDFAPTVFRPMPENPTEPRFSEESGPGPVWIDATEQPVAIACDSTGRLALITWRAVAMQDEAETWLHLRELDGRWLSPRRLVDAGQPASIAWQTAERIAVLPAARFLNGGLIQTREAIAYDPADTTPELLPVGGFLPVRDLTEALFLQGTSQPPHYPQSAHRHAPLLPISVAAFESIGVATARVLDAGRDGSVWHRLYLEAIFPPGCSALIELAATDRFDASAEELEWHPHGFGDWPPSDAVAGADISATHVRGVWLRDRSELPHHAGLLGAAPVPHRAGLFTALVQRSGRRVRRLQGRYLKVRVTLRGAGRQTPEIAALRVYASRFSYRDEYLPELYREERFGADADAAGVATGADFLERFLGLFESVLTPLEDRVAAAHLLTSPRSTTDEALEWLGAWIGVVFDPAFPAGRRRDWLEAAPRLFRARGTLAGLQLALEVATGGRLIREQVDGREQEVVRGGAVTGGEIVVIEDFRLRRTFATILGANLSLANDPLLPGLLISGNSRVGDTLILGEHERAELLALFRNAFASGPGERERGMEAVREFQSLLAHRITIFVHDQVQPMDFALIQAIARREAPAHLGIHVARATHPLLVGLASLVDVDTYLQPARPAGVAQLNRSRLGARDFVRHQPALDPRFGGAPWLQVPPVARIEAPSTVSAGAGLTLDGSGSSAAPEARVERYVWTLQSPSP